MTKVSKAEFRKALCGRAMAGCECLCGVDGADWLCNGRRVAAMRTGLFGSTYYLGE
jgi:hypothetical protein